MFDFDHSFKYGELSGVTGGNLWSKFASKEKDLLEMYVLFKALYDDGQTNNTD